MKCVLFFSGGRDAWKETESRLMPKNSMEEHGPKVFSFERETPSSEKTLTRVESPESGCRCNNEEVVKKVEDIGKPLVIDENPTYGFREGVKYIGAASAAESKANCENWKVPFQNVPKTRQDSGRMSMTLKALVLSAFESHAPWPALRIRAMT